MHYIILVNLLHEIKKQINFIFAFCHKTLGHGVYIDRRTSRYIFVNDMHDLERGREEMEVQIALNEEKKLVFTHADNFQELFKTYYPYVVRQIMRIVREKSAAEDIAQEVFLKLYNSNRNAIQNIPAWLSKASIHAAYNHIRSTNRRLIRDEKAGEEQPVYSPSSEENWLRQEDIQAVRQILTEMNERDRTLLMMKYSGFDYKELAHAAQVESSSVGTLLSRAKTKFRNMYKQMRGYQE
ncbi:Sigma-70 region 2 [Aneurinibacillus aneurinilyticus ATCC 12856]|uniref:Sigma-70 region 2 n=2 Tax=Aneurinibacillus aneurinilyticus TaxID=1391 RepID=U1WDL2_ANEAE|nr:Sigma-70 region 2 [Aneurinibacillus aneurinilyticus ATCC 12856]